MSNKACSFCGSFRCRQRQLPDICTGTNVESAACNMPNRKWRKLCNRQNLAFLNRRARLVGRKCGKVPKRRVSTFTATFHCSALFYEFVVFTQPCTRMALVDQKRTICGGRSKEEHCIELPMGQVFNYLPKNRPYSSEIFAPFKMRKIRW